MQNSQKEAIQNTLSTTTTNSKVLFYCELLFSSTLTLLKLIDPSIQVAGHGILRGPEVHGGEPSQSLIVGDNELINGEVKIWQLVLLGQFLKSNTPAVGAPFVALRRSGSVGFCYRAFFRFLVNLSFNLPEKYLGCN